MTCDRAPQVHAYHDRQLPPAGREAFEAHLAECPACAQRLDDVRAVSGLIARAPLPDVPAASNEHYYAAWDVVSRRQGLLRISSWLTAAAAAVLVGSLVLWPASDTTSPENLAHADTGEWEAVALMPPVDSGSDRPNEYIELAQWMADDLSDAGIQH